MLKELGKSETHIVFRGIGSISPLGASQQTVSESYKSQKPCFKNVTYQDEATPVATLTSDAEQELLNLKQSNPNYKNLDRSVLMAIYAAMQAVTAAGWAAESNDGLLQNLAVNIGSSRGATELFENYFSAFSKNQSNSISASASPTTTLGNLSSWVAQAVNAGGAQISHSITCSTALMAVANGTAWLKAGMASRFLAGGTEAPLTPFTIAQMKAIGIYSQLSDDAYPCKPFNGKQNTFVLGEGACIFALELADATALVPGDIIIESIGFGFEQIKSKTGISSEGINFQRSMSHALQQLPDHDKSVDLIITHTPGTKAGDAAELNAIEKTFGHKHPLLTTNKGLLGHTLGASGALSMELAWHLLKPNTSGSPIVPIIYKESTNSDTFYPPSRILVNAAGFGGNATSIVLKKYK